jgi:hypothetical protein
LVAKNALRAMLITRYLVDLGRAAGGELFGCGTGVSYGEHARSERIVWLRKAN